MKKLLIFLGALAAYGTDCTISDTVRTPFGGYFAGRIVVALNSPASAQPLYSGSQTLTGWQTTIEVPSTANGVVAFTLVCTDTITPSGTSYSARYQPTSGSGWAETWNPTTGTTTIRAMRATTVPTPTTTFQPSQIIPGSNGQVITTTAGATAWGSVPACATCVVTSGSYADPAWITSLAYSKITGGPTISNASTAYVETTGSDGTGVLGRPDKPFATINAALDALPAGGGVIRLGIGTFARPSDDAAGGSKLKNNVSFVGAQMPNFNSGNTGLENGTIIVGPLTFDSNVRSNIKLSNLGIDSGSAVVNANYGGTAKDGFVFANLSQTVTSPTSGLVLDHVIAITKSAASAVHSFLIENVSGPVGSDLIARYGQFGFAIKAIGGTFSNLSSSGNSQAGVIYKRSPYALATGTTITGISVSTVSAGDTAQCLWIQSDAASSLANFTANGVTCNGATTGIQFEGSVSQVTHSRVTGYSYTGVTNPIGYNNVDYLTTYVNTTDVQGSVVASPGAGPRLMPLNDSLSWIATPRSSSNTVYFNLATSDTTNSVKNVTYYAYKTGFSGANSIPSNYERVGFGYNGTRGQTAFIEVDKAGTGVYNPFCIYTSTLCRLWVGANGNIVLGGGTDDGSTTLQVNGTASATTFTGSLTGNASTATALASTVASGRIWYGNGTGAPGSASTFVYDSANGRLGVGTASPDMTGVFGDSTGTKYVAVDGAASGTTGGSAYIIRNGGAIIGVFGNASAVNGGAYDSTFRVYSANALHFSTGALGTPKAMITALGNLLLGTTTDLGYGLHAANKGTNGNLLVFDPTATTGTTKAVFAAGQGQSGNILEVRDYSATPGSGALRTYINSAGYLYAPYFASGTSVVLQTAAQAVTLANASTLSWVSISDATSGTRDLSLSRASAGVLQVGDGGANANGTLLAASIGLGTSPASISSYRVLDMDGTTGSLINLRQSGTSYAYLYANSSSLVLEARSSTSFKIVTGAVNQFTISNAGTATLYNETATTGNTKEVIRAGAGQSTNLTEWQNNAGTVLASVSTTGTVYGANVVSETAGLVLWLNSTIASAPSDGVLRLTNNAQTSFGRLQLGGTTSSFPSLKRSSAILQARLADDSAYTDIGVNAVIVNKAAPSASSDACTAGQLWAGDMGGTKYAFYCVASGTIVRSAFASF